MSINNRASERHAMVTEQIASRGIRNQLVLDAMRRVPRDAFVPERIRASAYEDTPLPIGAGQTISQPYIVGYMIDSLKLEGGETVLEIGSGSGYAAAILAQIAGQVYAVERIAELVERSRKALQSLDYGNVTIVKGDGSCGLSAHAPYDAILVSAGAPSAPQPLLSQLKVGGRLVIPVGDLELEQNLWRVTRISEDDYDCDNLGAVRFVPLIGDEGWHPTGTNPTDAPTWGVQDALWSEHD